jgi:UDP-N-acetylglucosamine--N-acetylmuramyl-(pentapeptide) pyrophosphoryl-undecaprenol N-acetylglucosamine transferase
MTISSSSRLRIAIAGGGTGGHLFPGIAVGEELRRRGCEVCLMVSPKEIDQQAVLGLQGMEIISLPVVGLTSGRLLAFAAGFLRSYRQVRRHFAQARPAAVLAMGGFTSASPVLAGKRAGAVTFLHESNAIPGRANRWLSRVVDGAFVGFPMAASRLKAAPVTVTGTPVRAEFHPRDAAGERQELGFDPAQPLLAVVGGSQGASGLNHCVAEALPRMRAEFPKLQYIHLTGKSERASVEKAYAASGARALLLEFSSEMPRLLGAADAVISRAGASSLAELAALRLPALLVPFPAATDNHQLFNARCLAEAGAALLVEQKDLGPDRVVQALRQLLLDEPWRERAKAALASAHHPGAAEQIATAILSACAVSAPALKPSDATLATVIG